MANGNSNPFMHSWLVPALLYSVTQQQNIRDPNSQRDSPLQQPNHLYIIISVLLCIRVAHVMALSLRSTIP